MNTDAATLRPLTAEQRYRQAQKKAEIIGRRNLRLYMRGEIPYLPCSNERPYVIAEMDRLVKALKSLGGSHG